MEINNTVIIVCSVVIGLILVYWLHIGSRSMSEAFDSLPTPMTANSDGNYVIPYGYLTDGLANGNPVSYDGLTSNQLLTLKHVGPQPKSTRSTKSNLTYIGHGIPLSGEEYKTKLPKGQKSMVDYINKDCRPDCCYGTKPSTRSCDRGCVCDN